DRNVQSSKMVHAALLLLMLEAVSTDLVFTISLKRSTQNLQLSTSSPADYPIYAVGPITFLPHNTCAEVHGKVRIMHQAFAPHIAFGLHPILVLRRPRSLTSSLPAHGRRGGRCSVRSLGTRRSMASTGTRSAFWKIEESAKQWPSVSPSMSPCVWPFLAQRGRWCPATKCRLIGPNRK